MAMVEVTEQEEEALVIDATASAGGLGDIFSMALVKEHRMVVVQPDAEAANGTAVAALVDVRELIGVNGMVYTSM